MKGCPTSWRGESWEMKPGQEHRCPSCTGQHKVRLKVFVPVGVRRCFVLVVNLVPLLVNFTCSLGK